MSEDQVTRVYVGSFWFQAEDGHSVQFFALPSCATGTGATEQEARASATGKMRQSVFAAMGEMRHTLIGDPVHTGTIVYEVTEWVKNVVVSDIKVTGLYVAGVRIPDELIETRHESNSD